MAIYLTRKNGPPTPFRNAEALPFFYFIPEWLLARCGRELYSIPRNPRLLFTNRAMCTLVESDLFLNLLSDASAYMVWEFMGSTEYMEIHSGYDPRWILAHSSIWIEEFLTTNVIPPVEVLYQKFNFEIPFVSHDFYNHFMSAFVPSVMKQRHLYEVLEVAEEMRCFEDFDFRESRKKTDFYRKWYHTRTKHPQISLEGFQEEYAKRHNGERWDVPDSTQEVEEYTASEVLVEQFMATLTDKDAKILQMRSDGHAYEEIAKKLGYKNHSGVQKRIQKIGQAYERFVGTDFGF